MTDDLTTEEKLAVIEAMLLAVTHEMSQLSKEVAHDLRMRLDDIANIMQVNGHQRLARHLRALTESALE